MSTTPRTDAAWSFAFTASEFSAASAARQMRDKCAELETELAAAKAECNRLYESSPTALDALTAELARLRAERAEAALAIERQTLSGTIKLKMYFEDEMERLLEENVKLNGYADMHMKEKARAERAEAEVERLDGCCEELHAVIDNHGYPSGIDYAEMTARAEKAEAALQKIRDVMRQDSNGKDPMDAVEDIMHAAVSEIPARSE